ncbi:sigma-70 family RNA polymerase sigma factor [Priestia flexa]|uniref:RNA polymerase sigma factor n=1 Tax=Priestia flexa TaxID=86664 RepID=UPI00099BB977
MKEQNDVILYNRIKQKDQAALELLYDKYERILYSFVYRLTNQPDLAEEVVQEVFVKIWRGKGIYHEGKGKFSSWLFTISRNTVIDLIRKRKSDPIFSAEVFDYIEGEQAKPAEEAEWQEEKLPVTPSNMFKLSRRAPRT